MVPTTKLVQKEMNVSASKSGVAVEAVQKSTAAPVALDSTTHQPGKKADKKGLTGGKTPESGLCGEWHFFNRFLIDIRRI
jgi:hypothetical protein